MPLDAVAPSLSPPKGDISLRLTAAQEEAADDAADRDYYMFESKNSNLNADRNPDSTKGSFTGPGNVNNTVKASQSCPPLCAPPLPFPSLVMPLSHPSSFPPSLGE